MTDWQKINYNYLDDLNEQQREAVNYNDGPSLVVAGAGSGKTRVLTYKIMHLIRQGFEPYRILALTFTNKAAREMEERINKILGSNIASRVRMGTFHSVFLRILRIHAEEIGFKQGFTIYDAADSRSLIKMIVKDFGLDEKDYKAATLASIFSNLKNNMILPSLYITDNDNYQNDKRAKRPMTGKIYEEYCERCKRANAMDFDDILLYMNILLSEHPDIRNHYREFFKYILVDEYQDTNRAQHSIIQLMANENDNVFLVGDDAQSIYSFRGANINNILQLKNTYEGLKIFKLERNYRSTQNIVKAADSLIEKNSHQIKKHLYSENSQGEKIRVIKTYSDIEEAFIISNLISQSKLSNHDTFEDYAILYRTNAQSRVLEESLRKRNINYRIYGGLSFYQRKEVKDMIAYFRMTVNPDDDEALKRIINFPPRGIGETTLKKLSSAAYSEKKSIWRVINEDNLKEIGLNSGTIQKVTNFRELIQEFINDYSKGSDAFSTGQLIFNRTGVLTLFAKENTPESISRQENLSEILAGLKQFVDDKIKIDEEANMLTFLSEIMLATDQDATEKDDIPKVTLMTVHAAKGLEFKHVYVVGVEEYLLPAALSQSSFEEVEEERRLLYVAITRAKETCVLSYARSRYKNGQSVMTHPSRFLSEISLRYLDLQSSSTLGDSKTIKVNPIKNYNSWNDRIRNDSTSKHTVSINAINEKKISIENKTVNNNLAEIGQGLKPQHTLNEIKVGDKILHARFGEGVIKKIDQMQGEDSISVDFGSFGVKKLLLKFAKFELKNE